MQEQAPAALAALGIPCLLAVRLGAGAPGQAVIAVSLLPLTAFAATGAAPLLGGPPLALSRAAQPSQRIVGKAREEHLQASGPSLLLVW